MVTKKYYIQKEDTLCIIVNMHSMSVKIILVSNKISSMNSIDVYRFMVVLYTSI
jgi:hypothetical protein